MQYTLLIYENNAQFENRTDENKKEAYWGAYMAYNKAVVEAGIMVGGNALLPPFAATSVSVKNGKRQVQDGPFADTKEQLGGYFVIDVPDLDAALDWAARCPAALNGIVEVRPVLSMN
ncbi:MAG: YciI family protein [Candidatus Caenarcaniphilales bacterium]|nr:YciI family protein [Candidatus Caenarcaniphilales bacterium]